MEQTRAINALAPFVALSKAANSPRAAADLVTQATSASNTYVFGELLQTPSIQKLREDAQYASHYTLLELFAWGTWAEYKGEKPINPKRLINPLINKQTASASSLPPLSPTQEHKLRLLTLLTLAANTTNTTPLTYTNLQSALTLPSPLALERLVTDAIYADLLTATLNPAQGIVVITSVAALRDLHPGSVTRIMSSLGVWSDRCDDLLKHLEVQMKGVKEAAERRAKDEAMRAEQIQRAEAAGKKVDDNADDAMELDDGANGQRQGGKKRGPGGGGGVGLGLGLRKR
jgi:COP9 signalosome complex subunit 7